MIPFLYKLGGAVAIALALWLYVADLRHDRDQARQEAAQARSAEKAAHVQADLNTTAGEAVERSQARSLSITVKASEAVHAVSVAPGASELVPAGVSSAHRLAIGELRDEAAAASDPARAGSADVARAVSAPVVAE